MADGRILKVLNPPKDSPSYERCAVAFLDVVGFSAMMGSDEESTFNRWKSMRAELIAPSIDKHNGQYVKSLGDGILATFQTAKLAVDWAIDLQRSSRQRGESMTMRIAVGFGDIIRDVDNDIAGDCVNITARLENESHAGGIIISKQCQEMTDGEFDHLLQPTGPLRLRNISQDIHAFHVLVDGRQFANSNHSSRLPSIAVLPFVSNEEKAVFSSGVVDDIIVSLGGVQELNVIARSSVKALGEHKHLDPREIGETLGVDYIVSGSIQKSRIAFRAETELIDARTAEVISTDRSVFKMDDLFEVQDQFVEKIVGIIAPEVKRASLERAMRKPPGNITAYESMLRALDKVSSFNKSDFEMSLVDLEAAISADPNFASPHAWIARWHTIRIGQGWSDNPAQDSKNALQSAQRAIRLNRRNALALATYGHVHAYTERDYETAIHYLDRAVSAGPNNAIAHALRSVTLSFLGRSKEALEAANFALRLSPFDEQLFQFFSFLSLAYYVDGQFSEAVKWGRRSLAENPNYTNTLKTITVAKAALGDFQGASKSAQELLSKEPNFSTRRYRALPNIFAEAWRVDKLIEHFNAAGISD